MDRVDGKRGLFVSLCARRGFCFVFEGRPTFHIWSLGLLPKYSRSAASRRRGYVGMRRGSWARTWTGGSSCAFRRYREQTEQTFITPVTWNLMALVCNYPRQLKAIPIVQHAKCHRIIEACIVNSSETVHDKKKWLAAKKLAIRSKLRCTACVGGGCRAG